MTNCDLCQSQALTPVYTPAGTMRGATVLLCENCGLLQSAFSNPKAPLPASISHDAPYGGLRIGKLGRAIPNLAQIAQVFTSYPTIPTEGRGNYFIPDAGKFHSRPLRVLDVGASRGAFVRQLLAWSPQSQVTALEPDASVTDWWMEAPDNVDLWITRIENIRLLPGHYSLIHLSHTLEHLDSPSTVLRQLRDALADDGWLFVEVPDIGAVMGYEDGVEQCFLDRHTFHYTWPVFKATIEAAGFVIEHQQKDGENLSVMARRGAGFRRSFDDNLLVQETKSLLARYQSNLARNRALLPDIAAVWNKLAQDRWVAVWGIGRLFSALVEAGLDTELPAGLYDRYLPDSLLDNIVSGREILRPSTTMRDFGTDIVMACSRTSQDEIKALARSLLPGVEVLGWDEV